MGGAPVDKHDLLRYTESLTGVYMSAIVLFPTNLDGNTNPEQCANGLLKWIVATPAMNSEYQKWSKALTFNDGYSDTLQDEFEAIYEQYVEATGNDEYSFFPGGNTKADFAKKMQRKLELAVYAAPKNKKDRDVVSSLIESKRAAVASQEGKTKMCRLQYEQSQRKLQWAQEDLAELEAKYALMNSLNNAEADDF